MTIRTTLLAFAFALVAACGGGSSQPDAGPDAGTHGNAAVDGGGSAGPAGGGGSSDAGDYLGSCTPGPGWTGNAQHVGAYCSAGGGQCDAYALSCAVDLSATQGGPYCIQLGCASNDACGAGACCYADQGFQVCVPQFCVVPDGGACPPLSSGDGGA